jgi:rhamnogalacturonan endolyase
MLDARTGEVLCAQYRVALAWQNAAYNQPPYPSFYLGNGMKAPPAPNIVARKAVR